MQPHNIYSKGTVVNQGRRVLFLKTLTLTPELENLGLQTLTPTPALKTWTLTPGTKSDSNSDSTYCVK